MDLEKAYKPSKYEKTIYQKWLDNNAFSPNYNSKEYFSIVLPPPNANANAHLGLNLTIALEDISARYNRLKGKDTLFIPGADHAGFETWVVYEKKLNKEGKTRFDYTNQELYSQVWEFVDQNKKKLLEQFKAMGISCDWNKFTYTLDEKVVSQAYSTFKKMWNDGLIYRGERLVNFCTHHGTSFSDIEVVFKTEKNKLWYIRYPVQDSNEYITIATTRPETMLGDTAIAVNPNDNRYKKYHGKNVIEPITGRVIPVVSDEIVEIGFGTGAVKITPAHDLNDYDLAQRHKLSMISVIDKKGTMVGEIPTHYKGLTVASARQLIVNELMKNNLLVKEEEYINRVGHCYKCNTVIQPLLSEQWFIDMKPLAKNAIKALQKNKIKFYPDTKLNQSIEYLKNIRDWNISRQIAWGIPIPAFQNLEDSKDWIYDDNVDKDEIIKNGKRYVRDSDVFDTWFSSSQWPYIVTDYPNGKDYKKFFPLTLMETGGEILYQWVCRMVMLSIYATGKIPFKSVYIHGLVLASDGSKMSKSTGNVIDPMPLIEEYGSDAVRIGLISGRASAVNRGFDLRRVEEARNFANKLWNVFRFIESKVKDTDVSSSKQPNNKNIQDDWILDRINTATKRVSDLLDGYRYTEAFEIIYHLVWDDFADWYIESSKQEFNTSVITYCLDSILTLTHPFAPFLTEVIWQNRSWKSNDLLVNNVWPKSIKVDSSHVKSFEKIINLIEEVRFIVANIKGKHVIDILHDNSEIIRHESLLNSFIKVNDFKVTKDREGLKLNSYQDVWIDMTTDQLMELKLTLNKRVVELEQKASIVEKRLKNKDYLKNAPKSLINESRNDLILLNKNISSLKEQVSKFS